jgi:hypothetical protein
LHYINNKRNEEKKEETKISSTAPISKAPAVQENEESKITVLLVHNSRSLNQVNLHPTAAMQPEAGKLIEYDQSRTNSIISDEEDIDENQEQDELDPE